MMLLIDVVALTAFLVVAVVLFDYALPATAALAWLGIGRRRAGLREHRLDLGSTSLPYLDGGRGAPLVLVHGFGADKDNFCLVAAHLTPHLRVIALDLPGFGAAPRDLGARHRIEDQVAHLRTFIHALGLGRMHLGGSSMGGFIVSKYAAAYPEDVASLWLLAPAGTEAALDTPLMRHYRKTGEVPLLVNTIGAFAGLLKVVTHRPSVLPHSLRRRLAQRAVADFELHSQIFREICDDSALLEPELPGIAAPTLVVWGAEDRVLNAAAAGVIGGLILGSEVVVMPGVGHLPMVERPRAVARDYLRFRAERTPASTA